MIERSVPAMLRECATLAPDGTGFTFVDYERDPAGLRESLTWSQTYRRVLAVARELRIVASPGDRAVLLAPQGLDYVVAFLGALEAGVIAVPLTGDLGGAADERVDSVLRDAAPTAILTTSSVVGDVVRRVTALPFESAPSIIETDLLSSDSPLASGCGRADFPDTAYLQYTSGSTREPTGVMISHENVLTNFAQLMSGYFADSGGVAPLDLTLVSWLPFYHDMGLVLGICAPILSGFHAVLTSPASFLQRPHRWMQLLATNSRAFSAAPNFAFELAARKSSDDDMAGLDLGNVHTILSGSERVQPATLERFAERFARFNLRASVLRPSYGLAEATVYVAAGDPGRPASIAHFDSGQLAEGRARRCPDAAGTALVGYPLRASPLVRIVDPDTRIECPEGTVGEIWVFGDNVAAGYWQRPGDTERTFGERISAPSPGTPESPWLRTGDSGFVSGGELFVIGRIKDLLIIYGRNHSPDDIEATIQEITRGRCAAIAVPGDGTEKLVAVAEFGPRGDADRLRVVTREVTAAISASHGVGVSDVVLVSPGSIPITTSGKVRRAECARLYHSGLFSRLDVSPRRSSSAARPAL
ncbi:AMP-binding protein [Mycobacterium sp. THU-M104]|uniref:AMP-binding protein n=1 Tax=Mycobacterium sp. THU-M104 TaxID=3410515 RepID=UPI003B99A48C